MASAASAAGAARFVSQLESGGATSRLSHAVVASGPRYRSKSCCSYYLSMNGCGNDRRTDPVEIRETRILSPVPAPELAVSQLSSAVAALDADPPSASSGIIRIEVPVMQKTEAINWLQAQDTLPRCFFSGREQTHDSVFLLGNGNGRVNGNANGSMQNSIASSADGAVSVAGVGSAVYFRRMDPFTLQDWRSIKRFLPRSSPLIRAYGAIRFDPSADVSSEWEEFGSFYFFVPQVEFNELSKSSRLAANIAWDESLLCPWRNAVDRLQHTISQISCPSLLSRIEVPRANIISRTHVPTRASWEVAVQKALSIIRRPDSQLLKVVLARSSRVITDKDIDPVTLLACLLVEGQNAYQFLIQPPNSPAFIGNTPEQLFHRKHLDVSSEALAGTRARGKSRDEDLQIEQDLLLSPKDDIEFAIVRETIRSKLENICNEVIIDPIKAIRKLPRVQHLSAQFTARLRTEDDEYNILSALHPSPAVCGLPREESRQFIADTEIFDRGMYAGPVGWFGGTESEFAVGIRSALVDKAVGTYIYAGAGIVEGTNPSFEWDEIELKASQFMKLLEYGSLGQVHKVR